jgi:hypothetical protein
LEGDDLSEELSNSNGGGEHTQVETHGVILVRNDEEQTISQDGPDEDVAKDSGNERFGVGYHDGAVPVDGDKVPCERSGYDSLVDEASIGWVAEVQRCQVEEVDNDQNLGPSEVASYEEHDESEVEQVVEDEVASHGTSSVQLLDVAREEVEDVATLEDEQYNPNYSSACHVGESSSYSRLPVYASNDLVHAEGSVIKSILGPYCVPPVAMLVVSGMVSIKRCVEGIVEADNDGKKPSDDG